MSDRFGLEQQILDCWGITDDIQSLIDGFDRSPMTEDTLLNVLIGLKDLYNLKFEKTFKTFEEVIVNARL